MNKEAMNKAKLVHKTWGLELWHHNDKKYCMKMLVLRRGCTSSMHMHKKKLETFLVVEGRVRLEYDRQVLVLDYGDSVDIEPRTYHRFAALTSYAVVIEASTHHSDKDVYRKKGSRKYGRV